MLKRSTILTCTICTLGLSGGIGGLVYELQKSEENNYPETEKLSKQASNLKQKVEELYKQLNNKVSNDTEKNKNISNLIELFFNLTNLQIQKNKITDKQNLSELKQEEITMNNLILQLKSSIDPEESEEIEEIAKNTALLEKDFMQIRKIIFKEISELIKKIMKLVPEIKEKISTTMNNNPNPKIQKDGAIENLKQNIFYFEIKKQPTKDNYFETEKINYEKEIKSKIYMNSKAKKIYYEIVKKLSIWYKFNGDFLIF